jgi:hypothetical protein
MNALVSISFTKVMDMPATTFTAVRGRGPLGSANQNLVDVFWTMTSSQASSPSVMALLHFYAITKTAVKDDALKVVYGFPINTYSKTAEKTMLSSNDGALALSTGMKLYIKAGDKPAEDYSGFYVPRMTPFFKDTGGNEIIVVVNSKRAVQCWSWGSYNGAGFSLLNDAKGLAYFAGKYRPLVQYAGYNMIICKLGKDAGTTGTGDVVIIPATQSAPFGTNVNNPVPL